jgi:hypothetical protein
VYVLLVVAVMLDILFPSLLAIPEHNYTFMDAM